MSAAFFDDIAPIRYAGPDSDDPLTFRWYDADRVVAGRTMAEQLRFAVCYWHSFNWPGNDAQVDGAQTWGRPSISPWRHWWTWPLATSRTSRSRTRSSRR